MGNDIHRMVLEPNAPEEVAERLAETLRSSGEGAHIVYSSLGSRRYRKPHFIAARDAGLRYIEIVGAGTDAIITAAEESIGPGRFLYRLWDDEDTDVLIPDRQWLATTYPDVDLDWLIEFGGDPPTKLDEAAFYSIPANPPELGVRIGIVAMDFAVGRPGEEHPCPRCGEPFTSKFSARQCRNQECRYIYFPFEWIESAITIIDVPLDAYGYGRCHRDRGTHGTCRKMQKFANKIEQCSCGQMLRGYSDKHSLELADNEAEIERILARIGQDLWTRYGDAYFWTSVRKRQQQAEKLFQSAMYASGSEKRKLYRESAEIFERLDSEGNLFEESHKQQAADARRLSRRLWWWPFSGQ